MTISYTFLSLWYFFIIISLHYRSVFTCSDLLSKLVSDKEECSLSESAAQRHSVILVRLWFQKERIDGLTLYLLATFSPF